MGGAGRGGAVPANLDIGNLTITLIDAVNSYFARNPFRTGGQPTAVLLHLDLVLAAGPTTHGAQNQTYAQANGVLNQTVLDIQSADTAKTEKFPDGSAGFVINAVGVFPIKLANTGTAIARLSLRLMMPVNDSTLLDTTAPILTA